MKRGAFFLAFIIFFSAAINSQSHSTTSGMFKVNGYVRDRSTNAPLAFANILIKDTQQGTATDDQGRFSLILNKGNYLLQFSYVGYKQEIIPLTVSGDTLIYITLNSIDMLLQNVTVYSNKQNDENEQKEVSALSLQSENIEKSTSLMSDVLRSVQFLPGVTADNELSAKFNVHGGNADENLVLINGTEVYEPYHVKEANDASIGIFNTAMIQKMDLITGGFTARYGDRMSSVVDIQYREGNTDHITGQASLSLTDFDALIEGPMGDKGSFIIGARESYTQYVLDLLNSSPGLNISFDDVQGVFAYKPVPQDKLSFKFIYAGDYFNHDPRENYYGPDFSSYIPQSGPRGSITQSWQDSSESHANYYTSMASLQNVNTISSKAILKSELSYYDQFDAEHAWSINQYWNTVSTPDIKAFGQDKDIYLLNDNVHIITLEANSSLNMQVASFFNTVSGLSYQHISYDQDHLSELTISEFNNEDYYPDTVNTTMNENNLDNSFVTVHAQSFKLAGYHENILQAGENLIFNIGGRFDYFDLDKELTWSPRINFAYNINPDFTIRGAWGHYYQSPVYEQIAYSAASDTNTKSQHAIHYVLGAEYNVITNAIKRNYLKIKLEGYYKKYDNLISSYVSSYGDTYYTKKNDAMGRAAGADLYIMYSSSIFSGWISYSLLKAEQKMNGNDYGYFPRSTDQRNTFDAVGDFDLGLDWDMTLRISYGSGFPYTPSNAVYNSSTKVWEWDLGDPNSAYLPAYKRVDIRVSKNFELFGCSSSAFLDISNLFDFTNVQSYEYTFDSQGQPLRDEEDLFPILPTLGLSVRF
jgi:hypothetical protein